MDGINEDYVHPIWDEAAAWNAILPYGVDPRLWAIMNGQYRTEVQRRQHELVGLSNPDRVEEYFTQAMERAAQSRRNHLPWGVKKYLVREEPDTPEYVWQDPFHPYRRSAVEAFGLTNHTDKPFTWEME